MSKDEVIMNVGFGSYMYSTRLKERRLIIASVGIECGIRPRTTVLGTSDQMLNTPQRGDTTILRQGRQFCIGARSCYTLQSPVDHASQNINLAGSPGPQGGSGVRCGDDPLGQFRLRERASGERHPVSTAWLTELHAISNSLI